MDQTGLFICAFHLRFALLGGLDLSIQPVEILVYDLFAVAQGTKKTLQGACCSPYVGMRRTNNAAMHFFGAPTRLRGDDELAFS
ncbi:hypothetical protein [Lampropedia aestuarii]|uniref:hypothetical protein n=1 Tax=Lampropedia aestuarii TaxID=2562762 RepID=UPI002468E2CA|nr:hypothetical protein [Lampropedia aestuarii]MDH5856939.1 hypothetical protein [Lampropedia aestuarii]